MIATEPFLIRTERLLIRPYQPSDVDGLAAILTDRETLAVWPAPLTHERVVGWVGRAIDQHQRDGLAMWAVEESDSGHFVGNVGVVLRTIDGEQIHEIGWHFNKNIWGRGYATEAARAALDHVMGERSLTRVVAMILPQNIASRRVAEKLSMTKVGTTTHADLLHDLFEIRGA